MLLRYQGVVNRFSRSLNAHEFACLYISQGYTAALVKRLWYNACAEIG
jgi:hypothetical protein